MTYMLILNCALKLVEEIILIVYRSKIWIERSKSISKIQTAERPVGVPDNT